MDYYYNTENYQVLSLDELKTDFDNFKREDPKTYESISFCDYLKDCLSKNGSLEKLLNFDDISLFGKYVDVCCYTDKGFFDGCYSVYADQIFCCMPYDAKVYGYTIEHV